MDAHDEPHRHDPRHDAEEVIIPDAVEGPSGARSSVDELARRSVAVLLGLLRRANALAGGVLIFSGVSCIVGYVLGIAALDGGARALWAVVGGAFALWAIGAVLLAMWRLRAVRVGSDALVSEVQALIGGDRASRRTVIETVESTEDADQAGVVFLSRQFFSLRDVVKDHRANFTNLTLALGSITSFPALMALATVIGFVFLTLSALFALTLIF